MQCSGSTLKQNAPKVSVIIPTYNSAQYINESIDSALNQTYKEFEIIVVDDGSTDNTKEVLKRYGDKISYYFQENSGVNKARFLGLTVAKGAFIALLDADDRWLPEKLKCQVEILDSYPDIDLVFSNFHDFYKSGFDRRTFFDQNRVFRKIPVKSISDVHPEYKIFASENILYDYLRGNFILPCTVTVRKTIVIKFEMFEKMVDGREFYEFGTRTFHQIKLGFVDKVLTHRRFHGSNLTFNRELVSKRTIEICTKAINYPWMDKKCQKFLKKELMNAYLKLGEYYFLKGRFLEGWGSLRLLFQKRCARTDIVVIYYVISSLLQEIFFIAKIIIKRVFKMLKII